MPGEGCIAAGFGPITGRRRQSGGRAGRIYRCTGRLACRRRIFRAPLSWRGPGGAARQFFVLRCPRRRSSVYAVTDKIRNRASVTPAHPSAPQASGLRTNISSAPLETPPPSLTANPPSMMSAARRCWVQMKILTSRARKLSVSSSCLRQEDLLYRNCKAYRL